MIATLSRCIRKATVASLRQYWVTIRPVAANYRCMSSTRETASVTFVKKNGKRITVDGNVGDTLLDIVIDNDVDIDGFGACEGTLACSTCHLIFKQSDFDKAKEKNKITDEELDMLDLAYELTDTSRLGCQVQLTRELDGLEVMVPEGVNDVRS